MEADIVQRGDIEFQRRYKLYKGSGQMKWAGAATVSKPASIGAGYNLFFHNHANIVVSLPILCSKICIDSFPNFPFRHHSQGPNCKTK
jgi:hypothetical protein